MSLLPAKIFIAVYGYGQYNTGRPSCMGVVENTVDVTATLLSMITSYPFSLQVTTSNLGVTDPAPGIVKSLTVFYTDGTPPDTVLENDYLVVQEFNPNGVPEPADCDVAQGVVSAWWGVPVGLGGNGTTNQVDVTDIVYAYSLHSVSLSPTQFFFGNRGVTDPAPGVVKTLLVRWTSCLEQGDGCSGPQTEGNPYVLPADLYP